jgi:hypothetical protein
LEKKKKKKNWAKIKYELTQIKTLQATITDTQQQTIIASQGHKQKISTIIAESKVLHK